MGRWRSRGARWLCALRRSRRRGSRFEHTLAFLRGRGHDLDDRRLWRRQDSQNAATLEFRPTGARARAIGSDPSRAHGLAPALVLADEPAQWPSTSSDRMLAALRTSMGKIQGSRLIALGTRPASEAHLVRPDACGWLRLQPGALRQPWRPAVPPADVGEGEPVAAGDAGAGEADQVGGKRRSLRPEPAGRVPRAPVEPGC